MMPCPAGLRSNEGKGLIELRGTQQPAIIIELHECKLMVPFALKRRQTAAVALLARYTAMSSWNTGGHNCRKA